MSEITIKDIAKICNVGVSTVSRAINNHPDINQETKKLIMNVIKEHNYIPNNSARNLKRTDAKTIAVLVKGIANPFFNNIIKIMEEEVKKKKYSLVLQHVEFGEDEVEVALELIKEKRLRGIVFLGGYFNHSEEKLGQLNVPFVLSTIGGSLETTNKITYSSISVDDEKESFSVVEYLINIGHKKIAILAADEQDESIGKLRLNGYLKAHEKNHILLNPNLIRTIKNKFQTYTIENGYEMTKDLLKSKEEFTALFAISDNMAIGACRAILEEGYKIPEDYSVVGYDGITMGAYYFPAISTLVQPVEEMALATIGLLFNVIRGKEQHQHIVFKGNLVIRESSRSII
ncbi:MAG: LacI family DNA-binding transcriptional regulator [Lachnospiraceae bacterium]